MKVFSAIVLFLLLVSCNASSAQTIILDSHDSLPISFANLVSNSGNLIATSNLEGIIIMDEISNYNTNDIKLVIIQHVSYMNKEISFENLRIIDTIYLTKRDFNLPEIVIKAEQPEVLVLKAYYRSYELDDNIPKYYTDGIIEYYIPINSRKKIKINLIEHRSFSNLELIKNEKQRKFMIQMRLAGIPNLSSYSVLKTLNKRKKDYTIHNISPSYQVIKKDTSIVGSIKIDEDTNCVQLNMDFIAPKVSETLTLFGYTSSIRSVDVTENFVFAELAELSLKNLISTKQHINTFFKHKKDDKGVELEGFDELYVFQRTFINKSTYEAINSSSYQFPESSIYSYEYWKSLNQYHIPSLNKNMENSLGTILAPNK